jgi:hypothetical protein
MTRPTPRFIALFAVLILSGCASVASIAPEAPDGGAIVPTAVLRSVHLAPVLEDRILALDADHLSGSDVSEVLAHGPAPHIILLYGGLYGTNLLMDSFAKFLIGMGYPEDKIRDPADGAFSQSPYRDSARLAGEVAWYYEHDGVRPMLIGHSQGGMQVVKTLHELKGAFADRVMVWNARLDEPEARDSIIDPLTGVRRSVVGVSVGFASAVGAGGAAFLLPNQWSMLHRLHTIPDSVDDFTGFSIAGDLVAWSFPGGDGTSRYRNEGAARVRNVTLPITYNHIFVPITDRLPEDQKAKDWIDAYFPVESGRPTDPDNIDGANILFAAEIWYSIKKHWCLEAQRLIRARRLVLAAP